MDKTEQELTATSAPETGAAAPSDRVCEEKSAKAKKPKREKKDWRRVKSISPMHRTEFFIMKWRCDSTNSFKDRIALDRVDPYIRQKQAEGLTNFNLMHVILAAYIRTLSQRPAANRFLRGQKLFTRKKVEVALDIKKEMTIDSPDTVIKILFDPTDTAEDVYRKLNAKIEEYRAEQDSAFDRFAKVLNYIPRLLMRGAMAVIRFFDYFGLLPKSWTDLSPFHASFFITSMGSLGIPPVVHHLYNFGTVPVFCAFGAKQREFKLNPDGSVYKYQYFDIAFTLDERICDGFYYASAMKLFKSYFRSPEQLDVPPETVVEDIR